MSLDIVLQFVTLVLFLLGQIVIFAIAFSKLSSRILFCEDNIKALHKKDTLIAEEIKTLHKIEGQLELLITYLVPKKN